jgi:hypothetical protein
MGFWTIYALHALLLQMNVGAGIIAACFTKVG